MRRLAVVVIVACNRAPAPSPLEAHRVPAAITLLPPDQLIERDYRQWQLVPLPPLPGRRGIDLAEEKSCRAQLEHVRNAVATSDDLARLVRTAAQTSGDCRIDADEMLGGMARLRVGGCMGARAEEVRLDWVRVAIVATTRARRVVALRNVAMLAWRAATWTHDVDKWLATGDAFTRALEDSTERESLAAWAVDAYENALRVATSAADARTIGARLAAITEGAAGDRAYVLRGISARLAASARPRTPASASLDHARAAR